MSNERIVLENAMKLKKGEKMLTFRFKYLGVIFLAVGILMILFDGSNVGAHATFISPIGFLGGIFAGAGIIQTRHAIAMDHLIKNVSLDSIEKRLSDIKNKSNA